MSRLAILLILPLIAIVLGQEQSAPPFLQGASKDKVDEFNKLMASSGGKSDTQIDDMVKEWVGKQDDSIKVAEC